MHLQSSVSHFGWVTSFFSNRVFSSFIAISFSLILSACGGGGNSVTENDLPEPTSDGIAPVLRVFQFFSLKREKRALMVLQSSASQ